MATVTIGQMNKRISFYQITKTDDTSGGKTGADAAWFTTWAFVRKMNGKRAFDHGFDGLQNNYDMYCRYRSSMSALTKDTRITYDGKDFGIRTYELVDEEKSIYHFQVEETH